MNKKKPEDNFRQEFASLLSEDLLLLKGLDEFYCQHLSAKHPEYEGVRFDLLWISQRGICLCEDDRTSRLAIIPITELDTETMIQVGQQIQNKAVDIHPAKKIWDGISGKYRYYLLRTYMEYTDQGEMIYDIEDGYHESLWTVADRTGIHLQEFLDWIIKYTS